MATVVFGNSPRHHNRIMVASSSGNISSDPNYTNQMIPPPIPPHRPHSTSPAYHHPQQLGIPHPYATLTTTSIISQKIYMPSPIPSAQYNTLQPPPLPAKQSHHAQYHSLPASISIHQPLPPQLPQKMRQRFYPGNSNGVNLPIDVGTIAHARLVKRKTAVELLAESKPYYVKSELVLDRQQRLQHRNAAAAGERTMKSSMSELSNLPYNAHSTQTLPHQRSSSYTNRRSGGSADTELLQTKLRRLLNDPGSGNSNRDQPNQQQQSQTSNLNCDNNNSGYFYERPNNDPDISNSCSNKPKTLPKLLSPQRLNQELTIQSISDQNSDNLLIYPSAFLSPQSLPPQNFLSDDDLPSYDYCDNDDSLVLTTDYETISPPAEYAESRQYGRQDNLSRPGYYHRSNSHSQAIDSDEITMKGKSHKSLPDLHAQINRHSPHSDAMSYRSRGNRSSKSGSSLNRDSGGSSGHYTQRSEISRQLPSPPQITKLMDYRRDSGSSTQHSDNWYRRGCVECSETHQCGEDCLINFTTSEVPDAFKDDYVCDLSPQSSPQKQYRSVYLTENRSNNQISDNDKSPDGIHAERKGSGDTDVSPPIGIFRRQKCLRLKQHPNRYSSSDHARSDDAHSQDDRRPILRSKSDISHRYWNRNRNENTELSNTNQSTEKSNERKKSIDSLHELQEFFDHLGLNEQKYDEFITEKHANDSNRSSPVYFSDTSTVDSTRLLDSTETQATIAPYRPIETTSIVERNARIIKWLCVCRKSQMT